MIRYNRNAQKSGVVAFDYFLDNYKPQQVNYDHFRIGPKIIQSIPIRFVAIYSLLQDSNWNHVIDIIYYIMGKVLRLRARSIHGSKQECIYNLLCLGFSKKNIPKELYEVDEEVEEDVDNRTKYDANEKYGIGDVKKRKLVHHHQHPTVIEYN